MQLLAILGLAQAHAFCGTYVSSAGTDVYNSASEVVIARQGTRTTLTMANDVLGDPSNFAMVVPVPQVVREQDVHVVKPENLEQIRVYSMPRLVSYTCDDFAPTYSHPCPWMEEACPSETMGEGEGADVTVEAEYIVGEYELVVLSAEQSGALLSWLAEEGYDVPVSTANMLQSYIDGGSYFLAARVYPEAGVGDGDTLSPLQFSYDSEVFGLPIRIGTASSAGVQDLVVYAFTDLEDGAVGIANYPELEVEDECMWDGQGDFDQFYADQFQRAYEQQGGALWNTEYSWRNEPQLQKCDPCTGPPPEVQELTNVGFDANQPPSFHVTRLHVRYTPEQATQDLVFYMSRQSDNRQKRYIEYYEGFEERFPLCNDGWAANPGSCDDVDPYEDTVCISQADWQAQCAGEFEADSDSETKDGCGDGCSTAGRTVPVWLAGLGLVVLGLRRRT